MFKRIGVLAFILGAGTLLQPLAASAQDRFDYRYDHRIERYRVSTGNISLSVGTAGIAIDL